MAEVDPRDVIEGYAISRRYMDKVAVMRKYQGDLALAERAEAGLEQLRAADLEVTYEQAVATALNEDPGLYQP
jgi:hypothetical protein